MCNGTSQNGRCNQGLALPGTITNSLQKHQSHGDPIMGHVSPQFHVRHDDSFETMSDKAMNFKSPAPEWMKLSSLVLTKQPSSEERTRSPERATLLHPIHSGTHVNKQQDDRPPFSEQQEDNGGDPDWSQGQQDDPTDSVTQEASEGDAHGVESPVDASWTTRSGRIVRDTHSVC